LIKGFDNAIEKKLKKSLRFISKTETSNNFKIQSKEHLLNNCEAETYLLKKKFMVAFQTDEILGQDRRNNLLRSKTKFTLRNDNSNLIFDFKSFSNINYLFMNNPRRMECTVRKYYNEEIRSRKAHYYRLLIPTEKILEVGGIFESELLKIEGTVYSRGVLLINNNNRKYHLYAHSNKSEKNKYLVIDSLFRSTFNEFLSSVKTILLSYSFVTGYYPREKWYFLSSNTQSFEKIYGIYYETLPKSLKSIYSIFPSSKYRIFYNLPRHIEFPQSSFNKLCSTLQNNKELARVLFLVVEGHTLSTEIKAAVYSVALESITNIISHENSNKTVPIQDKKVSRNLIKELKSTLGKFSVVLSKESIDTIIKKINVINSPTNKQKLLIPFEVYNIKLNSKEINCINMRNDFLHGRVPKNNTKDDEKYNLEQIAFTLLYCVVALVLKYVEYTGYVLYYPSLIEISQKGKLSDFIIKSI